MMPPRNENRPMVASARLEQRDYRAAGRRGAFGPYDEIPWIPDLETDRAMCLSRDVPEISIRPATIEDAEALYTWRNDPGTRSASNSTDEVAYGGHVTWLRASLSNTSRRLCILEVDGVPAGTCRFDYEDFSGNCPTEFSFTIAPEFRGKGLSRELCRVAVQAEPFHISHCKPENIAIQKLLSAAGCRHVGDDRGLQVWQYGDPAKRQAVSG